MLEESTNHVQEVSGQCSSGTLSVACSVFIHALSAALLCLH